MDTCIYELSSISNSNHYFGEVASANIVNGFFFYNPGFSWGGGGGGIKYKIYPYFLDRGLLLNHGFLEVKLRSPQSFTVTTMTCLTVTEYLCNTLPRLHMYIPFVVITIRSYFHSWSITGFLTRVTSRVPLGEQELRSITDHMLWSPVFMGICCLFFCFLPFICPQNVYDMINRSREHNTHI